MQVFLTNENLAINAMELDDSRLSAQCKETIQLLCGMENLDKFIKDDNVKIGHSNHPIFQNYYSMGNMMFLTEYLSYLCKEYYYRFGKQHQSYFTMQYFIQQYGFYSGQCEDEFGDICECKLAYVKGQKDKDQIITTENVYELYRELLCEKWNNDKTEPKWTRRNIPSWYTPMTDISLMDFLLGDI